MPGRNAINRGEDFPNVLLKIHIRRHERRPRHGPENLELGIRKTRAEAQEWKKLANCCQRLRKLWLAYPYQENRKRR